jgi:hypothetical protein
MNLTIQGLEDRLVEEISEYEHGKCALTHDELFPCSVTAVAYTSTICDDDRPLLSCAVAANYFLDAIQTGIYECECGRACEDCWKVVWLP